MGEVYLARRDDDAFQRRVAIKVVRGYSDRNALLRRFRSERQILASLDHPNIAQFLDGGSDAEGNPHLVMEFIEGLPIDRYCDESRLTVRERIELVVQVCDAVQSAHQKLVVHRDIKPSNVLVTPEGVPKLLDFGIAKILHPDLFPHTVELTRTLQGPLSPLCASPEQLLGRPIGTASDVYSLGVLLFKLLTGRYPRKVRSLAPEVVEDVLAEEVELLSRVVLDTEKAWEHDLSSAELAAQRRTQPGGLSRELRGDLDTILLKALRVEMRQRYVSVDSLKEDLKAHLEGLPIKARPDSMTYVMGKFVRRHGVWLSVAATLFIMVSVFGLVMTRQARELVRQRDQVAVERDRAERVSHFMVGLFDIRGFGLQTGEEVTVRQILDQSAKRIPSDLEGQPEIEADLLWAIGKVYIELGLFRSAGNSLQRVVDLRTGLADSEQLAESLLDLCFARDSEGEVGIARDLALRALALAKEIYRNDDKRLLRYLSYSSHLEETLGDSYAALFLLEEMAEVADNSSGMSVEDRALLSHRRSNLYSFIGEDNEALFFAEKAYRLKPKSMNMIRNLAACYREVENYSRAEALFESGFDVAGSRGDLLHETIHLRLPYAVNFYDKRDLDRAEKEFEILESDLLRLWDGQSPDVRMRFYLAETYLFMARIKSSRGDIVSSSGLLQLAWAQLGDSSDETTWVGDAKSQILLEQGRVDEARPIAERLLAQGWRYRDFDKFCARYGIFPPIKDDADFPELLILPREPR